MPSDPKREALLDRIRKLSKMTTANGCTEAEAAQAAVILAKLITTHNVDDTELSLKASRGEYGTDCFVEIVSDKFLDWGRVAMRIGKIFHTKVWYAICEEDLLDLGFTQTVRKINFFGAPADRAASVALAEIVYSALATFGEQFTASRTPTRSNAKIRAQIAYELASFRAGMVARIYERLADLLPSPVLSTGTGLMVLKDQLVTEEFAKLGLRLKNTHAPTRNLDPNAYNAGFAAGANVRFGQSAELTGTRAIGYSK